MKVIFLQLGKGGVLRHRMADLPADGTRWDVSPAPTVTLYDGLGGTLRVVTPAIAGPVTTLSSAASSGSHTLPVTSSSTLERWQDYVLGPNAAGQWEWFTLEGKGPALTTLDPLTYPYATSAAVRSHDLTTLVTSGSIPSVSYNCRADWAYAVDGVPRVESTSFHISRYAPRCGLTAAALRRRDPRIAELLADGQRLDLMVRQLWEERVLSDIFKLWRPGATISGSDCDEALYVLLQQQVALRNRDFEAADKYASAYLARMDELRLSAPDLDEDGVTSAREVAPGAYSVRLVRS